MEDDNKVQDQVHDKVHDKGGWKDLKSAKQIRIRQLANVRKYGLKKSASISDAWPVKSQFAVATEKHFRYWSRADEFSF